MHLLALLCLLVPLHLLPHNTRLKPPRTGPNRGYFLHSQTHHQRGYYPGLSETGAHAELSLPQSPPAHNPLWSRPPATSNLHRFLCPVSRSRSRGTAFTCAPRGRRTSIAACTRSRACIFFAAPAQFTPHSPPDFEALHSLAQLFRAFCACFPRPALICDLEIRVVFRHKPTSASQL